jgi:hypothetical protein
MAPKAQNRLKAPARSGVQAGNRPSRGLGGLERQVESCILTITTIKTILTRSIRKYFYFAGPRTFGSLKEGISKRWSEIVLAP